MQPPIFSNVQESWSKVSHAKRELPTAFSVTFSIVTIVGQLVKTSPPPTESVSAHQGFRSIPNFNG